MRTTEYQWLAVRCCCAPTKVLGFLRVTTEQAKQRYIVLPPKMHREEITDAKYPWPKMELSLEPGVQLEIKTIGDSTRPPDYVFELAIYSEDRPIEFWREVKGFVEVGAPPKSTSRDWDAMDLEKYRTGEVRAPGGSDF